MGRRPRKTYHHGNLPPALVQVAKALIIERGLDGFTLREVARRVGVTHVAAYRHYADRRALLAAVSESGFHQLHRRLERARRKAPPAVEPRLRAVLAAYLHFCWAERALAAVMFGPRLGRHGEFPELEAAVFATFGPIEDTITSLAPAAARKGRSARTLALALWTFEATPTNIRAFLPEVLSLVRAGRIAPERVTTAVLSWETLPEALVEPSMKPVFVRDQVHPQPRGTA